MNDPRIPEKERRQKYIKQLREYFGNLESINWDNVSTDDMTIILLVLYKKGNKSWING